MNLVNFVLRWWAAFALAACLALLGIAILLFEWGLGYAPCHLCMEQRWVYVWTGLAAAVGLVCTEIPLLVPPEASPLPVLDSTRLLARAAFDAAAGRRPPPTWRGGPVAG